MIQDLKTWIWVDALIRRAEIFGASAFVTHKGDRDSGSVIIRIIKGRTTVKILTPSRDINGNLIWVNLAPRIIKQNAEDYENELIINDYIEKRIKQDRDLWSIEIEDKEGRDFMLEKVE